jgi:thioredoxin reductase (NADPH)
MTKPVLLTVDDDPQVLGAIARDLRRRYGNEYRVLRAGSGEEALEALDELEAKKEPVALLLSDQRMPRMDGVAFLQEARKRFPSSKRALLTAYADTDAAISAINRSQVDYYLLKPWDPPEEKLFPILDDLLEEWKGAWRPPFQGVTVVGDRWSKESHALRDFLARNQVPYRFLDVEGSDEAVELLEAAAGGGEAASSGTRNGGGPGGDGDGGPGGGSTPSPGLPLVVLEDGQRLRAPTLLELGRHVGLRTRPSERFHDLVIIGAGPAGLAAAVYGGSEGLSTVMVEEQAPGGQAGTSSRIENYLGFPSGLSGADLARRGVTQAKRFGVEILTPQTATGLRVEGPYKHVTLADGSEVSAHVLMLSLGVTWRRLPAEGADPLTGKGVFYGATMTEALGCQGETVYMVGAGNSAGQAALHFADHADGVVMVVRGDSIEEKMSRYLVDRIRETPNIQVLLQHEVRSCVGEDRLECLVLEDRASGEQRKVSTGYLFSFIGAAPPTEWLNGVVALDSRGFILTGPDLQPHHLAEWPLERAPFLLETSVPGIFAAGDVRADSIKRVASAVGEGSVAVHFIHRVLGTV